MGAAEPLSSVLWVKQRLCAVSLDPARALLSWWRSRGPGAGVPGADACSVPVSEIITVEEQDVHGKRSASGKWQKMERLYAFTVHYVQRARQHRWKWTKVTFCCADEQLCHLWLQTLRELLENLRSTDCVCYSTVGINDVETSTLHIILGRSLFRWLWPEEALCTAVSVLTLRELMVARSSLSSRPRPHCQQGSVSAASCP
uniref:Ceramide kinase n=1 Tax=Equus caballus TaxID=9796 RepID=A0A9L0QY08_HORSE